MAEIRALARSWPHERDRGWYEQPIGSGVWRLLWDSGCHKLCRRCELEALLDKMERNHPAH